MSDNERRSSKFPKVEQNHDILVTHIDHSNMDHYCSVRIHPDRMFPNGTTKTGIKIAFTEFNKGCNVLGQRCGYRLLTPLSSKAYAAYLHRATQDYMRKRDGTETGKPVIEVKNQSPFRYKERNFVCSKNSDVTEVFEIFSKQDVNQEYARKVAVEELPFIINWSGLEIKPMVADDRGCLESMVRIINALDELQPNIEGLGVCILAEFGRFLIYPLLVDGEQNEDDESSDGNSAIFRGYKQMILVLQSETVETGKSFLCEVLARIFYGSKHGICSTVSFDSARRLLGKGEPVIIDDYSNDDVGCVLLSRSSKAIWGQSDITMRGVTTTPRANLLLCTNEDIEDLRVEGRSKKEIFQKMSVIFLGEEPLSQSDCKNKEDKFREILTESRNLRHCLPSFFGISLKACGSYVTNDEFKEYKNITIHERLANILKNCKNLYDDLKSFCEKEKVDLPKSLKNPLNTSCLVTKSELSIKLIKPEEVMEYVMSKNQKMFITDHNSETGVMFDYKPLTGLTWFKETFTSKREGVVVFNKMRTRKLNPDSDGRSYAAFIGFKHLDSETSKKINQYAELMVETEIGCVEDEIWKGSNAEADPVADHFHKEFDQYVKSQYAAFCAFENFVKELVVPGSSKSAFHCDRCQFIAKSKSGLTQHKKKCRGKKV